MTAGQDDCLDQGCRSDRRHGKGTGGFIIQMMPYAQEETIRSLEEHLKDYSSITSHLDAGETPEKIMETLFGDMGYVVEDKMPTRFYCNCSKERVKNAVVSVGKKEIEEMIEEGKPIEVNCHFCNSHYLFDVDELKELLAEAK